MLQGQAADRLAELVESHGGEVTHYLPIINAVGALMTRQQLNAALESPLVGRYLDDLSIEEKPDDDTNSGAATCHGRGALELDRSDNAVTWRLYNKQETPLHLQSLDLAWPDRLGTAVTISLDGQEIRKRFIVANEPGKLEVIFPPNNAPAITTPSALTVQFPTASGSTNATTVKQREFGFSAGFGPDCTETLIPGYDDNFGDSYYPGVAEAEELHLHGVTGMGVSVAVLDSGLWEHDSLALDTHGEQRVLARFDAILGVEGDSVFDESGHGTHLTSALANSDPIIRNGIPTGAFKGIAPDARIVAIKAFNERGQGGFLDIVRGIQWAVDHRKTHNIRVLNLSFAAPPRWQYWLDPINQALMQAWAAGITVVAAAGNEGPDPMSVGSPGNLPYIITVGAVTDSWTPDTRDDDYVPDFSSRGPTPSAHIKPDIVAPGGHVIGLTRPGATLTRQHPEYMLSDNVLVMTGTSQASAVVSGIAALLLQLEPDLTPDDVKCKLISSSDLAINRDGLLTYSPFQQGYGYVSAKRAVTLGQRGCGNSDLNLQEDIAGTRHFEGPAIVTSEGSVSLPGLDRMVSAEEPAKGFSESRKWGAKAHIERELDNSGQKPNNNAIFNWAERYREEKLRIDELATTPRK
jgi:subtilisin family serine protease